MFLQLSKFWLVVFVFYNSSSVYGMESQHYVARPTKEDFETNIPYCPVFLV